MFCLILIFIYSFYAVASHIENNENKDPGEIIIDEFIGQSIPIYLYEISHGTEKTSQEAIIFYGICFILFRYFDIIKPFPVSFFDKNFKNSFGVIMDDVCAGFYVVLIINLFHDFKKLYFLMKNLVKKLIKKNLKFLLQSLVQEECLLAQLLLSVVHLKYSD